VLDATATYVAQDPTRAGQWRRTVRFELAGGVQGKSIDEPGLSGEAFGNAQLEASWLRRAAGDRTTTFARVWVGFASGGAPEERLPAIGARSASDLFLNHWVRPRGGLLSDADVPFVVPGGAGMRGYAPYFPISQAAALNLEQAYRVRAFGAGQRLGLFGTAFANALAPISVDVTNADIVYETGLGLALRGPLFDRDVRLRVDVPAYLSHPHLAIGARETREKLGFRLSFAASDLW
jgi:hypothetical protein